MKNYKFFNNDIVKFEYKTTKCYYKVIKDPENFFIIDYELLPWEVYENTINLCWDWNKLTKLKTKYADTILKYWLFRLYKNRRLKCKN